jgi:hypothetical protein
MKIINIISESKALYSCYFIPEKIRNKLLLKFPPKYSRVYAHHITFEYGVNAKLPPDAKIKIVGYCDSNTGVEVLVCEVNNTIDRPDGSIYHITWSLNNGYRPVDSNRILKEYGWSNIEPKEIHLEHKIITD